VFPGVRPDSVAYQVPAAIVGTGVSVITGKKIFPGTVPIGVVLRALYRTQGTGRIAFPGAGLVRDDRLRFQKVIE